MIHHMWSVICSNTVIDRDTNLVSLFNVIEQFNIEENPDPKALITIGFEIVTLWTRSDPDTPCQGRSRVILKRPDGEQAPIIEMDVDLSQYERVRSRGIIRGVPRVPGRYTFRVELQEEEKGLEWREVAALPVNVTVKPQKDDVASEEQPA